MQRTPESSLRRVLAGWRGDDPTRIAVAATIEAIADAATDLSELIRRGPLAGDLADVVGSNADGDAQKSLDVRAHEQFMAALATAPVSVVGSEEADAPIVLDPTHPLAVVIDPLDGSSNIALNSSIGTIFGILPSDDDPDRAVLQPGERLLAAGFVVYGPFTAMMLSMGDGVALYVLSPDHEGFVRTADGLQVPTGCAQYAINASNQRHWTPAVRTFIDDCIEGPEGPRRTDFNMRWIASLVAESYRILTQGGMFLYPADSREGYENGRLRLVYEANPIAYLVEQAGGAATTVVDRILELQPTSLHQRTPLVFGDHELVEQLRRQATTPGRKGHRPPLFNKRGLFRKP